MKRGTSLVGVALLAAASASAQDTARYVLRVSPDAVSEVCATQQLTLVRQLGHPELYLVSAPGWISPKDLKAAVEADSRVGFIEPEGGAAAPETQTAPEWAGSHAYVQAALSDRRLTDFFGAAVWTGYFNQPAIAHVHVPEAQQAQMRGGGIVAVIDTGVDPNHPALKGALVPGYDFASEQEGIPSEFRGLEQSTAAILEGPATSILTIEQTIKGALTQSTAAILEGGPVPLSPTTSVVLDARTAAALGQQPLPAAFGHGTMVAGLIRRVAPAARIMPIRAFQADGSSRSSDIIRAIYYAVDHGAQVINMSFSLESFSDGILRAINYAGRRGVICVAAVGNANKETLVYPAALGNAIGVASTTLADTRAGFSNYGADMVKLSAPGEELITTYPGGRYASVAGTSFSTALVAGAAAVLVGLDPYVDGAAATRALSRGRFISEPMGFARIDVYAAGMALRRGR
jgi:subtilisin family serine protease